MQADIVLLGSIASGKYVDILHAAFGKRLCFPVDFVGRGDMSRGGLMLRCAQDRRELPYVPVAGAIRKGKRPPKLAPRRHNLHSQTAGPGDRPGPVAKHGVHTKNA